MAQLQELNGFKVGQKVVVKQNNYGQIAKSVKTIKKITDGHGGTIFVDGMRFNKDGMQRGDGLHKAMITPATEKDFITIKHLRNRSILSTVKFGGMPLELATETMEFLKEKGWNPEEHRKRT
jgi:hypothetical protein